MEFEQVLQQTNQPFAVGMQKAKVASPPEAFGQDMLKHQPQELRPGQGSGTQVLSLTVAVTKSHFAVLTGDDIVFLNHAFI